MEAQTIICPNCQTPNPAKNLYCQSCGKPIVPAPAVEIPPPPPADLPAPVYSQMPPAAPPQQPQPYQVGPMPQQQPLYPPPPMMPPAAPSAPVLEKLGVRKAEWHAIAGGAADKARQVQDLFADELRGRAIPLVTVDRAEFSSGLSRKAYQLVRHPAGSVVVSAEAVGRDLSLSWAMYVPQTPKIKMLGILAGVAFVVSFLTSLNVVGNFGYFFVDWVFGTFRWLMEVAVLAIIGGYVWKGSFWYFFVETPDEIARENLTALKLSVSQSLTSAAARAGIEISQLEED
jgi:hypothetical protein